MFSGDRTVSVTTDDWSLYVEENALIAEFGADIETKEEVFAAVNERFEELATDPAIDTHVSVLKMESALNGEVFEKAQEAAEAGTEYGIANWIIVSDDIKKMALKSKIGEIPGVDIETVDSLDEALRVAA